MIHSSLRAGLTALLLSAAISLCCAQSNSSRGTYFFQGSRDQGRLGVSIESVTRELREKQKLSVDRGAYVLDVGEDSPAEKAGIKEGDVIVRFDGDKIDDCADLIRRVRRTKPKKEVSVELVRKDEHKVVAVTIGREPSMRAYSFDFGDGKLKPLPRMPRFSRSFGTREFYGLGVQDLTKQLADYFEVPGRKGVLVAEVKTGTAAEKAGFKAGDVIVKADGNTIAPTEDLREELSDREDGDISFGIMRKGKPLTLSMKLERQNGGEGDEDEMSFDLMLPRFHPPDSFDRTLRSREFTARTLEALREYLREFKNGLKNDLQELRQNLKTHFSHL